jgi:hypothetical protein
VDASGSVVRTFASTDSIEPIETDLNVPTYWVRPRQRVATSRGSHRFVWDLHYSPPKVFGHDYPISAIYGDTPRGPLGPAVLPGDYTVRLRVNGQTFTQPLTVKMDPRAPITAAGLRQQHDIAVRMNAAIDRDFAALTELRARRGVLRTQREGAKAKEVADSLVALDSTLARLDIGTGATGVGLARLNEQLATVLDIVESADMDPTSQTITAAGELEKSLDRALAQWADIKRTRFTQSTR